MEFHDALLLKDPEINVACEHEMMYEHQQYQLYFVISSTSRRLQRLYGWDTESRMIVHKPIIMILLSLPVKKLFELLVVYPRIIASHVDGFTAYDDIINHHSVYHTSGCFKCQYNSSLICEFRYNDSIYLINTNNGNTFWYLETDNDVDVSYSQLKEVSGDFVPLPRISCKSAMTILPVNHAI